MKIYENLINKRGKLAVVGLGYVGMPIAIAFAKKNIDVIGFDTNEEKIQLYKDGIDPTKEVGDDIIKNTKMVFTTNEVDLRSADFIIVAVPTPINLDHTPDLSPVIGASEIVGRNLKNGAIVSYESTVYPGVTEDICLPILENYSNLKCGKDFKIAYSPERINPGDKVHRLENITKIVSGIDEDTLKGVENIYNIVVEVGTFPVSSIKTAEAIKVVENSQRDVNIAFMNELAKVFDMMAIDTNEVVVGMNTKWNALGFKPGLVGGHCIGVDPYYFTYQAEKLGYHSQIILNGRIVNDSMAKFVSEATIKKLIQSNKKIKNSRIGIFGLTFKENCPDIRNSKIIDVIKDLKEYGVETIVVDPWVKKEDAKREFDIDLISLEDVKDLDGIIMAVAHEEFVSLNLDELNSFYKEVEDERKVLIDVKGIYNIDDLNSTDYTWWRL